VKGRATNSHRKRCNSHTRTCCADCLDGRRLYHRSYRRNLLPLQAGRHHGSYCGSGKSYPSVGTVPCQSANPPHPIGRRNGGGTEHCESSLFPQEERQIADLVLGDLKTDVTWCLYQPTALSINTAWPHWGADKLVDRQDLGNGNLGVAMRAIDGMDHFASLIFAFGVDGQGASITWKDIDRAIWVCHS